MNSAPPPFGDPTRVQQANRSAVGRGIAAGCGGCAVVSFAVLALVACIVIGVFSLLRNSDAAQDSLQRAQSNVAMREAVGEPMELGWLTTGSVSYHNSEGAANMMVTVHGPKGKAKVHAVGTRDGDAPWHYTEMTATLEADGRQIDLLKP